eukprot:CAMPEP_0177719370 /NCGR_PEP_ID=MMETSP0484_2-20121128/16067_1 /TAXON_ID=354590 /ORGANISM="Rhodomonas lens, Strain RHODO" /LENGTH=86 /DNA_ID=CAMNT_0019231583 /DNA_START=251 /DNA_END=508 /DNA_ORIENTATION=+
MPDLAAHVARLAEVGAVGLAVRRGSTAVALRLVRALRGNVSCLLAVVARLAACASAHPPASAAVAAAASITTTVAATTVAAATVAA